MNIVLNKYIFAYLCIFYSSTKYFHEFQSIFVNFCITDIFVKISSDVFVKISSDVFVKISSDVFVKIVTPQNPGVR